MSPATILGTALGTAAVTAGRGVAIAAGNGLSFAAQLLRAAGGPAVVSASEAPDDGGLPEGLLLRIKELSQRISRQLAAAGIRLLQPAELMSDGLGGIAVAGGHPQRAAIEELLAADYLLLRDFQQLAGEYAAVAAEQGDLPPTLNIAVSATG